MLSSGTLIKITIKSNVLYTLCYQLLPHVVFHFVLNIIATMFYPKLLHNKEHFKVFYNCVISISPKLSYGEWSIFSFADTFDKSNTFFPLVLFH